MDDDIVLFVYEVLILKTAIECYQLIRKYYTFGIHIK